MCFGRKLFCIFLTPSELRCMCLCPVSMSWWELFKQCPCTEQQHSAESQNFEPIRSRRALKMWWTRGHSVLVLWGRTANRESQLSGGNGTLQRGLECVSAMKWTSVSLPETLRAKPQNMMRPWLTSIAVFRILFSDWYHSTVLGLTHEHCTSTCPVCCASDVYINTHVTIVLLPYVVWKISNSKKKTVSPTTAVIVSATHSLHSDDQSWLKVQPHTIGIKETAMFQL